MSLEEIYGIGPVAAKKLQKKIKGVDVRKELMADDIFSKLSVLTKADLLYNPCKLIKREYITIIESEMRKYLSAKHEIAGSYRRQKPFSRDVDMVMVHKPFNLARVTKLVNKINLSKKIKVVHVFSQGPVKLGCIIRLVDHNFNVKMDIFAASRHDYMYQLLFTTGSAKFNIFTRAIAKRRGYLLNQHGLFQNGALVPITNEKQLFKFLKIKYLLPHER